MKKILKNFLRQFGLDIIRYKPDAGTGKISKRTEALTFYETQTGNYYLPTDALADGVANTIKNNHIFEERVVEIACKYIKPGTAVLDVGANFGQMSVLFSNAVGAKGKVYSFDADDFVFEILKKNINANGLSGNINPIFGAVSNVDNKTLYFPIQDFIEFGSYGSYGVDYNGNNGREVKSLTIDSLNIQEPISFMKVDIQGGDLEAMQGAVQTIKKNQMPIIFEYEYQFEDKYNLSFQKYVDFVLSINYRFEKVIYGHNYLIIPNK